MAPSPPSDHQTTNSNDWIAACQPTLNHTEAAPGKCLSRQFCNLIHSRPAPTDHDIHTLQTLLAKLINTGFLARDSHPIHPEHFFASVWPHLLATLRRDPPPAAPRLLWRAAIASLPRTELKTLLAGLLLHLQSALPPPAPHDPFSTAPETAAAEHAGAEILAFLLGPWGAENRRGSCDIHELLTEIVTRSEGWTVLTARWIARWTTLEESTPAARARLAHAALAAFASVNQIAQGSPGHHTFLLVLLLLTAAPIDPHHPTTDHPNIALDPVFVAAIQRSLGSLRTQFRLMGMLMAELLTGFSRLPGDPTLDFGHDFQNHNGAPEDRLCLNIRNLALAWPVDPPETRWRELLASVASATDTQHTTGHQESRDITQRSTTYTDPNELPLSELRLTPPGKPQIEVSSDLEAYAISDEDLQTLYPARPAGRETSPAEPELDVAQMKDPVPAPVYLAQLAAFLKDGDDGEKVRVGLVHAERLIRRKAGWGSDLHEHAIDLTYTLLNLHDTTAMAGFERLRQRALLALAVSEPLRVGPCMLEQLFFPQYSLVQRLGILDVLVLATLELGDPARLAQLAPAHGPTEEPFKTVQAPAVHQLLLAHQSSPAPAPDSHGALPARARQPPPTKLSARLAAQRRLAAAASPATDEPCPRGVAERTEVEQTFLAALVGGLAAHLALQDPATTGGLAGAGTRALSEPLLVRKLVHAGRLLVLRLLAPAARMAPATVGLLRDAVRVLLALLRVLCRPIPPEDLQGSVDAPAVAADNARSFEALAAQILDLC
ncbi:hypothetical protein PtB15_12B446 [Puccinia triticina]|nr:hypothetical protein PtB15_12B446 [Puccinia triticina]